MSEIEVDPKAPEGWLDTWLSEVAKTDNMRLRGNAAIALATLGGPARIDEFIELVGDTAIKMKEGRGGAAEAVAVALREVERPDFDREALTRAFEKSRNDDRPERLAARALLMPAHPVVAWWRLRGVAPWAGWWRTLGLAAPLAIGSMVILLVAMWVLIDWRGGLELVGANGGQLFFLLGAVILGSVAMSRVAVAGQRTRIGLILDGLVCGVLGASPLVLVALLATADKSLSKEPHVVPMLWAHFAIGALALGSVRVFVGVSPTGRRRLPAVLSAIAWPVSIMTIGAPLAAWVLGAWPSKGMDLVQATLSWTWITFVVAAPAMAAGVGAADDLRRTNVTPFGIFRPPHPATLLIVPIIAVGALVSRANEDAMPFEVTADQVSGPFTIPNDRPFVLTFPKGSSPPGDKGLELAFEPTAKDYVLDVGRGDYLPIQGRKSVTAPYERSDEPEITVGPPPPDAAAGRIALAQASMIPLGRHYVLKDQKYERLCMVQRNNRRCGVPSAQAGWWLQILSGRTERLGQHKALNFYVYRPTAPRAEPVALPDEAPGMWNAKDAGLVRTITPTEAHPALQIEARRSYYLRVGPVSPDPILDRVVIVQQLGGDKDSYMVWSTDDPDPPHLNMLLQPNQTYLVCLRLVHATFLDCTHQTRGMLFEPIELILANRPSDLGPDLPQAAPGPAPPLGSRGP